MAWYEYPTNISSAGELFQWSNTALNGNFGLFIIIATWVISFLALRFQGAMKASTVSSFIALAIGIFLYRISVIDITIVVLLIGLLIISLIMVRKENQALGL